jgi:hypothetical protein
MNVIVRHVIKKFLTGQKPITNQRSKRLIYWIDKNINNFIFRLKYGNKHQYIENSNPSFTWFL